MAKQARPSTRSKGRPSPNSRPEKRTTYTGRPVRAHRDDTPEAREQRKRTPKTHPKSRAQGAQRKDVDKNWQETQRRGSLESRVI
jgi:hypothetical protein